MKKEVKMGLGNVSWRQKSCEGHRRRWFFLFLFLLLLMFSGWRTSTLWGRALTGVILRPSDAGPPLCPVALQWRWVQLVAHISVVIKSLDSWASEAPLASK